MMDRLTFKKHAPVAVAVRAMAWNLDRGACLGSLMVLLVSSSDCVPSDDAGAFDVGSYFSSENMPSVAW